MEKGSAVQAIFQIVIIVIILVMALAIFSSFSEAAPELDEQNNIVDLVENVCRIGGPVADSTSVFLASKDNKVFKLHLTAGRQIELYKCSNTGPGCSDADMIKVKTLSCPDDMNFTNCWVAPSTEGAQVTVLKDTITKTISFNQTSGVYC